MPHKHTRREHDPSSYVRLGSLLGFDLPPSLVAKPLPVTRGRNSQQPAAKNAKPENVAPSKKRKKRSGDDDTPRAFKRLMALAQGKKQRSGLDDGQPPKKKKGSKKADKKDEETAEPVKPEMPSIRPGEKMADFAARVDAALPLSGLVNKTVKNGNDPVGLKVQRTRKERKMHKLYDQWREEERKIQERREEELEEVAERELDEEINGGTFGTFGMTRADIEGSGQGGKKKKGKKRKGVANHEEDPWAVLKKMRGEVKPGLHDVVQAPPELPKLARDKLLVRGAAVNVSNVPKSAGSLRKREELQEIREELVAAYRKGREEKLARLVASS
ncbi:hypothetical protein CPLU01_10811 [Colletotrichum plurivorum]|uniref:Urease accessory protein n=1 Tax=Colletotrichum plurivorum TaxID=2175906 RepID=A0A8H6K4Y4_9PEZI|nr:hypothetical protein CPLU01_10811 [Colletotrichum plurivorum]